MRPRHLSPLVLLPFLLVAATGCGKGPDPTRLEQARAAVGAAEASGAAEFAPEALTAAQRALDEAEKQYKKQAGFRLTRSAEKAHAAVEEAVTHAAEAQTVGEAGTMLALETARSDLASAETAVIDLEGQMAQLVSCHKRGIRVAGIRDLLASFKGIKESLSTATAQFDSREYTAASAGTEAVLGRAKQLAGDARQAKHGSRCS